MTIKKIIQAATLALLTSQGACSNVPVIAPKDEVSPPGDLTGIVKEHWIGYVQGIYRGLEQEFKTEKKSCSVKKKKLNLSMSCYVPSEHPLHKKDGFYFTYNMSNFMAFSGGATDRETLLVENGRKKFDYHAINYPQFFMRRVNFEIPSLCEKLGANPDFPAQDCTDQVSVSLSNNEFNFSPKTSTDPLEILSQGKRIHSLLRGAYNFENNLEDQLRINEWFEDQIRIVQQERWETLEPLAKEFEATIKATQSYQSLIGKAKFEILFEQYSFLADPVIDITKLKSSVSDPALLNDTLRNISEDSKEIPEFDRLALQKTNVYIADSMEEIQKKCRNQAAGACYDSGIKTLILARENLSSGILTHELTHRFIYELPIGVRAKIIRKLQPLLMKTEIQRDAVRKKELVKSWQDGSNEPRFNCPDSYAASNFDEFVAVYKNDLFSHQGERIISLLNPENKKYHQDIITTLDTLAESGLFGEQGREVLDDVYRRVVIRYAN